MNSSLLFSFVALFIYSVNSHEYGKHRHHNRNQYTEKANSYQVESSDNYGNNNNNGYGNSDLVNNEHSSYGSASSAYNKPRTSSY